MIVKYAIANITAREIALEAQSQGFEGSTYSGFGFGPIYGIEPTTFVEFALGDGIDGLDLFVRRILFSHNEESAYRTVDGKDAVLLHVTGRIDKI